MVIMNCISNGKRVFPSLLLVALTASFTVSLGPTALADEPAAPAAAAGDATAKKSSPPAVPEPRAFKMPTVEEYQLPNGMNVQLVPDRRTPFVTFGMGIKSGSALEPREKRGLADVTAGMISEGTKTRTSKQIAEEVDFIGGGLSAGSDPDFTLISGSSLSQYKDRLFAVLADVVLNPIFPEDELKLQKTNITQGIINRRSDPGFLGDERFAKVVYGEHPYSVSLPTPENIAAIKREDVVNWHKQHFLPNETYLVVVGDFKVPEMKALIDKAFETWKPGRLNELAEGQLPKLTGQRIYLVDRPGSVQSTIKVGNLGIKRTDPDYFPVLVANQILGGGGNARLFLNLREQKGYTYGAYSHFSPHRDAGTFAAEADVRSEVTGPALKELLAELGKMRDGEVSDKELRESKSYIVGSYQLGLETQGSIAQRLLDAKLFGLPKDYLEKYSQNVMAVTVADVHRVARSHMDLDNITITVVGDAAKVKNDLTPFAPIELYDIQGKFVTSPSQDKRGDAGG